MADRVYINRAICADLRSLAERRRRLDAERAYVMQQMRYHVRLGAERGMPIAALARLAGITRRTVYAMLDDRQRNAA
jgi:hypothetical protein